MDGLTIQGGLLVNSNVDADFNGGLNVAGVSTFQNHVHLGNDDKLILGDDDDLEIFHNSSNGNTIIQKPLVVISLLKGSNLFLQSSSC